jgi:hypothetical protein
MSITRLQQARQMYAMGQRVGRIAFGGGGSQDRHGGGYQGSRASKSSNSPGNPGNRTTSRSTNKATSSGDPGGNKRPTTVTSQNIDNITLTGDDYTNARRDYQMGISRVGPLDNKTGYTGAAYDPLAKNPYQNFLDYRPEINIPNFGFLGMAANLAKKPIQKFADFTTEKNRNYFMDEVVRAGRIPGLDLEL